MQKAVLDPKIVEDVFAFCVEEPVVPIALGRVAQFNIFVHSACCNLEDEMTDSEDQSGEITKKIVDAISWAYDRVIEEDNFGLPGAVRLANEYLGQENNVEAAIESLINWQTIQAGTVGFVTGLGGFLTLPVALPANLASVLYLQLRMIATIAHLRGYDINSDKVRTLAIACLVGSSVGDLLKDVGINVGTKLTQQAIKRVPGAALVRINQAVGFRLATKAGSTGAVNLSRLVPFVGGVVSGAFDAATTRAIGAAATTLFLSANQETISQPVVATTNGAAGE